MLSCFLMVTNYRLVKLLPYAQAYLECSFPTYPDLFPMASELQYCLISKPFQLSLSFVQNSMRNYKELQN